MRWLCLCSFEQRMGNSVLQLSRSECDTKGMASVYEDAAVMSLRPM